MNEVVVVIPVHSSTPTPYELISFKQCFKVLGKHPIQVLAPKGLDLDKYREAVPEFQIVFIEPEWQSSLANYNKLKISAFFYKKFSNYKFLLTYELDCFVFKDELSYWCAKGFDYIGAPWFDGYSTPGLNASLVGVGNSGFSLRNISSSIKVIQNIFFRNPMDTPLPGLKIGLTYLKVGYRWVRNQFGENYTLKSAGNIHEDFFFSSIAPQYYSDFTVAPVNDALKFSFEVNPRILLSHNNGELPMGCHAWWRYDFAFWRPIIESYGYSFDDKV